MELGILHFAEVNLTMPSIKPNEQAGQHKTSQPSNPTTRIHKHQMRHTTLLKPCANSNPTFGSGSNRPSL